MTPDASPGRGTMPSRPKCFTRSHTSVVRSAAFLNAALLTTLVWLRVKHFGLLGMVPLPGLASGVIGVLALDLSFYVAHVAMHRVPAFWCYHRVHHADPAVDVTTTIRQHPGESV